MVTTGDTPTRHNAPASPGRLCYGGHRVGDGWRSGGHFASALSVSVLARTHAREAGAVCQRFAWAPTFALVLLKPGPLVSSVAGSIGGVTFQRGPGFFSARSKPLPRRRRTKYTALQRQTTASLAAKWRALSPSDRTDWQTAADAIEWKNRFGDVIPGRGYWLYIRCNQYLALSGGAYTDKPLTPETFTPIEGLTLTYESKPTVLLNFGPPAGPDANTAWLIFTTPPMSAGRSATFGDYRLVRVFTTGVSNEVDVTDDWLARFGVPIPVGSQLFVKVLPVGTVSGYMGVPVTVAGIATP